MDHTTPHYCFRLPFEFEEITLRKNIYIIELNMKRKIVLGVWIILLVVAGAKAQGTGDLLIGAGLDLLKSNNSGFGDQVQIGAEVNYFINSEFSVTGGLENWTAGTTSLVLGGRYYIQNNVFARIRGIIGDNDISVGGGYSHSLNKNWKLEAMGDIYFEGDFAIRGGVAYLLNK